MGRLFTCPVDDTLFRLVESLEDWNCFPWGEHIWTHLYDQIQNVIEKHSDEYYFGMKRDQMYVPMYSLSGFVFAFHVWIFKSFERCNCWWIKDPNVIPRVVGWSKKSIFNRSDCGYLFAKVLARERKNEYGLLQFKDEFSRLGRDFMNSLNILFEELSQPLYTDENLSNDYLVEEELRLCLEAEERMCLEHETNIIEEQRFRVNEAKRMKLEEEKLLEISDMPGKTKATDPGIYCQTLVCLDPTRKGWLSEEHIDLWVDYMWHGRPDNANWAMVSCYFVHILLQNSTPLFYANGDKYATPRSDVDQGLWEMEKDYPNKDIRSLAYDLVARLDKIRDGPPKVTSFSNILSNDKPIKKINFRTLRSVEQLEDTDFVLPVEAIAEVKNKFANSLVGFFVGKSVAFPLVQN
ncbi:hypothetical protein Tco_0848414 [Tanacetum coccineum]